MTQTVYGKSRTLIVTYNANLFQTQYLTLQKDITKAMTELGTLRQRLQDRARGLITGGQCPPVDSLTKQCQSILSRPYMKQIIRYTVEKDNRDIPQLEYDIDHDVIKQLSDTYLGKNLIITDREQWGNDQTILARIKKSTSTVSIVRLRFCSERWRTAGSNKRGLTSR